MGLESRELAAPPAQGCAARRFVLVVDQSGVAFLGVAASRDLGVSRFVTRTGESHVQDVYQSVGSNLFLSRLL